MFYLIAWLPVPVLSGPITKSQWRNLRWCHPIFSSKSDRSDDLLVIVIKTNDFLLIVTTPALLRLPSNRLSNVKQKTNVY